MRLRTTIAIAATALTCLEFAAAQAPAQQREPQPTLQRQPTVEQPAAAAPQAPTGTFQVHPALRPAPAPADATAGDSQLAQAREWLVAYLMAHEGYHLSQMDQLEERVNRMTPTQVDTLVDFYHQKHEIALQREAANAYIQQQNLAINQTQLNQRWQQQMNYQRELEAAASGEQSRLNQQQTIQQSATPNRFNYGPGYGPYSLYDPFYSQYWY
jgi:hypothetical protein